MRKESVWLPCLTPLKETGVSEGGKSSFTRACLKPAEPTVQPLPRPRTYLPRRECPDPGVVPCQRSYVVSVCLTDTPCSSHPVFPVLISPSGLDGGSSLVLLSGPHRMSERQLASLSHLIHSCLEVSCPDSGEWTRNFPAVLANRSLEWTPKEGSEPTVGGNGPG